MPGGERAFLDTNILVYAFTVRDPRKRVAEELIISGGMIGVQTINEFICVQRGKLKEKWPTILDWLRILDHLCPPPIPLTRSVHTSGLRIAQDSGYHIYDSLMLAAAIEASCTVFYSEDMRAGHMIGGLTIRNPFAAAGSEPLRL